MPLLFYGYYRSIQGINFLAPLADLAIRLWVAKIFFYSGLTKIQSWDSTLALFEYEYAVPVLSPATAALLATAAELSLPVLLLLGLAGRFSAASLFILNLVAVNSYPDINIAGVKDHIFWGALLAISFFHGPGKISIDFWIYRYFDNKYSKS